MPVGAPGGVTWTLQADFSGTAFGGTPTWTDITAYWMSSSTDPGGSPASIPWGRQDQASTVEGATTSFVLNNADGRFTPGKTSSPYYPNVRRHVRMRLTCTDGTTTNTVVDGLVDTWDVTPQTDGPTLATAALSDPFGRLSASTTLRSLAIEEMLVDQPLCLYPLDDAGPAAVADVSGESKAAPIKNSKYGAGTVAFGVDPVTLAGATGVLSLSSPDSGTLISNARGSWVEVPNVVPAGSPFAIEIWFQGSYHGAYEYLWSSYPVFGSAKEQLSLQVANTNIAASLNGAAGVHVDPQNNTTSALDAVWHQAVVTLEPDGKTSHIYLDGALSATAAAGSAIAYAASAAPITLGVQHSAIGSAVSQPFSGLLAFFGVYPTALSATRVAAHYNAVSTLLAGESTSARWARLLTYRPNIGGTTTGTVGTVGAADTAGQSLGDALTEVAVAEGGVIDTSRGSLNLIGRTYQRNPAPVLTLDAALGQVDIPTTWRDDPQGFVNDVTVSRPNGATQRQFNAASITADGSSQTSVTANVNSDRDAADMAGWMVAVGTQEAITSPTLTVNLYARASSALTLAVCALKTYDTVKLINLPATAPASTMTLQVQGGQVTVGAKDCTVQLFTTATPPGVGAVTASPDPTSALGRVVAW